MMNQNFCSGQFKNIAEVKISSHKNSIRMIGWRQLDSFQEETILNVNINLTKIKSLPFKKVIGLKEKMKNQLD